MRRFSARETLWLQQLDGIELASFWRRAGAFVLDCMVALVLFVGALIAGTLAYFVIRRVSGHPLPPVNIVLHREQLNFNRTDGTALGALGGEWAHALYFTITPIVYFGLGTWIGRGRTLGKWLFQIRVVSLVHRHLTLWHSVERALGYGAAALELGFGFVQFFLHPYARCAQDRLAETIVVTERGFRGMQLQGPRPQREAVKVDADVVRASAPLEAVTEP